MMIVGTVGRLLFEAAAPEASKRADQTAAADPPHPFSQMARIRVESSVAAFASVLGAVPDGLFWVGDKADVNDPRVSGDASPVVSEGLSINPSSTDESVEVDVPVVSALAASGFDEVGTAIVGGCPGVCSAQFCKASEQAVNDASNAVSVRSKGEGDEAPVPKPDEMDKVLLDSLGARPLARLAVPIPAIVSDEAPLLAILSRFKRTSAPTIAEASKTTR
jgi:hypothetical protein